MVEKGSDALAATDASVDNGGASTEEGAGSIVDGDSAEVPGSNEANEDIASGEELNSDAWHDGGASSGSSVDTLSADDTYENSEGNTEEPEVMTEE